MSDRDGSSTPPGRGPARHQPGNGETAETAAGAKEVTASRWARRDHHRGEHRPEYRRLGCFPRANPLRQRRRDGGERERAKGGKKGTGGRKGVKTSECDEARLGSTRRKFPDPGSRKGSRDRCSGGGSLGFEEVKTGTCADAIPWRRCRYRASSKHRHQASVNVTIAGWASPRRHRRHQRAQSLRSRTSSS
jgi:hypothetical protein